MFGLHRALVAPIVALGLIAGAPLVDAATYTVGNNSEFKDALSKVNPGDTIKLKDGQYKDTTFTASRSGTSSAKITITAVNWHKAVLKGNVKFKITGDYIRVRGLKWEEAKITDSNVIRIENSRYSSVEDCRFYKSGRTNNAQAPNILIQDNSTNVLIKKNIFDNPYGQCITIGTDKGYNERNKIEQNTFKNIKKVQDRHGGATNGMEAIQVGTGSNSGYNLKTIIKSNTFEECIGDGSETISVKTTGNTIESNTFKNCAPVTLRSGNQSDVLKNTFKDTSFNSNRDGGLRVYGQGHEIKQNKFENCYSYSIWCDAGYDSSHSKAKDAVIDNNNFVNARDHVIKVGRSNSGNQPTNIQIKNNYGTRRSGSTWVKKYSGATCSQSNNSVNVN